MNAFLKTLIGDAGTVTVVAIVMTAEVLLVAGGQAGWAVAAVPILALAGIAWLAQR